MNNFDSIQLEKLRLFEPSPARLPEFEHQIDAFIELNPAGKADFKGW